MPEVPFVVVSSQLKELASIFVDTKELSDIDPLIVPYILNISWYHAGIR